jgi:hypothetical protein
LRLGVLPPPPPPPTPPPQNFKMKINLSPLLGLVVWIFESPLRFLASAGQLLIVNVLVVDYLYALRFLASGRQLFGLGA